MNTVRKGWIVGNQDENDNVLTYVHVDRQRSLVKPRKNAFPFHVARERTRPFRSVWHVVENSRPVADKNGRALRFGTALNAMKRAETLAKARRWVPPMARSITAVGPSS